MKVLNNATPIENRETQRQFKIICDPKTQEKYKITPVTQRPQVFEMIIMYLKSLRKQIPTISQKPPSLETETKVKNRSLV